MTDKKNCERPEHPLEGIVGRGCTCHPDDGPPKPCPRMYALSECRKREAAERAMFEYWMSDGGEFPKAIEHIGGVYKLMQTQTCWNAWKARAYLTPNASLSRAPLSGASDSKR